MNSQWKKKYVCSYYSMFKCKYNVFNNYFQLLKRWCPQFCKKYFEYSKINKAWSLLTPILSSFLSLFLLPSPTFLTEDLAILLIDS